MENINRHKNWEPIDFTVYFDFIKWPIVILIVAQIIFHFLLGKVELLSGREWLDWLLRLAVFGYIGWQSFKLFGESKAVAAISGGVAGLLAGLFLGLYRFFEGVAIWKFFNLITESITVGLVGALVVLLTVYLLTIKNN